MIRISSVTIVVRSDFVRQRRGSSMFCVLFCESTTLLNRKFVLTVPLLSHLNFEKVFDVFG